MPELNKTRKKYKFPDSCCFAGNTRNVQKLKTIECSLPLKNYPMECPSCSETFWRFDMKKHFTISHPQEVIPEVAIIPEEEQNLIRRRKASERILQRKMVSRDWWTKSLLCCPSQTFGTTRRKSGNQAYMALLGIGTAIA